MYEVLWLEVSCLVCNDVCLSINFRLCLKNYGIHVNIRDYYFTWGFLNITIFFKRNGIFSRKWLKESLKSFAKIDVNGGMNRSSSSKVKKKWYLQTVLRQPNLMHILLPEIENKLPKLQTEIVEIHTFRAGKRCIESKEKSAGYLSKKSNQEASSKILPRLFIQKLAWNAWILKQNLMHLSILFYTLLFRINWSSWSWINTTHDKQTGIIKRC